jgi:signal transduction histidine kinase
MLDRLDAGLERERRFVADASHELRTPLAALRTELELATRRPRSAEELENALLSASEEVERLVRLAEDLLVLARADDGQLPLRVAEHGAEAMLDAVASRNAARAAARGRSLRVTASGDVVLRADGRRIEQALDILVDNALRHGDGTVGLAAEAANGRVVLTVSDDGRGFRRRSSRTRSSASAARMRLGAREDAGLGLAIVRAIAQAHGGSADAADRGEGGVNVWIALPTRLNAGDAARRDSRDVG